MYLKLHVNLYDQSNVSGQMPMLYYSSSLHVLAPNSYTSVEEEVIRRATLTKPHCQATLHQRCPPPGAQGGARPQNRAPTLPTSNSQRQARPKPPEQLPILVQPQLTVRRTAPRTNRS